MRTGGRTKHKFSKYRKALNWARTVGMLFAHELFKGAMYTAGAGATRYFHSLYFAPACLLQSK